MGRGSGAGGDAGPAGPRPFWAGQAAHEVGGASLGALPAGVQSTRIPPPPPPPPPAVPGSTCRMHTTRKNQRPFMTLELSDWALRQQGAEIRAGRRK